MCALNTPGRNPRRPNTAMLRKKSAPDKPRDPGSILKDYIPSPPYPHPGLCHWCGNKPDARRIRDIQLHNTGVRRPALHATDRNGPIDARITTPSESLKVHSLTGGGGQIPIGRFPIPLQNTCPPGFRPLLDHLPLLLRGGRNIRAARDRQSQTRDNEPQSKPHG